MTPTKDIKIAMVVQRYGTEIIGGAESLTRQIAEKLHSDLGMAVDVYTTTAKDYNTWKNEYNETSETINGVTVHRFNSVFGRFKHFNHFNHLSEIWLKHIRRYKSLVLLQVLIEQLWIILQGPFSPKLVRQLRRDAHSYRKIIFVTYLYYPTIFGVKHLASKAILIPCAHDEWPFHFQIITNLLNSVKSILSNSPPEARLIQSKLKRAGIVVNHAGIGFDETMIIPKPRDPMAPRYFLYLGRISAAKGVGQLLGWFLSLKDKGHFSSIKLLLAGQLESNVTIPNHPDVEYLGFVHEAQKLDLIRNSLAVINPSPHESLSMIVIDALALKIPVAVNAHCEVLRFYTEEVDTAFGFRDEASFAAQMQHIVTSPWNDPEYEKKLSVSREWALRHFSWTNVLATYKRHILDEF